MMAGTSTTASTRFFFVLVSVRQGGNACMEKFGHNLLLPYKCTTEEFKNIPLAGIPPSKLLYDRSSSSNMVRCPKNTGTLPDKPFRDRLIYWMDNKCVKVVGIPPVNRLFERFRRTIWSSWLISSGISPLRLLWERSMPKESGGPAKSSFGDKNPLSLLEDKLS